MSQAKSYEEDLYIDPDKLDEEWLRQPAAYLYYGERLADAQRDVDSVKEELDVLKATVDREARVQPGKYGIDKVTESAVSAAVTRDERIIAKGRELIEARHTVGVLKAAVEAMSQRKKALEKLSDLFIFGWNAEPRAGRADSIREHKKRQREKDTLREEAVEEMRDED